MAGPQDTTWRLRQVTRRQFTAAVGLGLTAVGASFAVADCASGTSTTSARPTVATRPAPSATPPLAPPEGPLLDPFTGEPVKALGPVLAVKIDNIVYARPQTGLQSADIIYVIPVEGRASGVFRLDVPLAVQARRGPPHQRHASGLQPTRCAWPRRCPARRSGDAPRSAVAEQELYVLEPLVEVAGLLHGPLVGGVRGHTTKMQPAGESAGQPLNRVFERYRVMCKCSSPGHRAGSISRPRACQEILADIYLWTSNEREVI